jgi:hypothetical protein
VTDPATAAEELVEDHEPAPAYPRTGLLLVLGLAWLAAILWVAHASIMADTRLALSTAAIALPTVIATSVVAGAIAGFATVTMLAARGVGIVARVLPRIGLSLGAGLVTSGLGSLAILLTFGAQTSVATIAIAVAVAGVLGGALGALRPAEVAAAGFTAALAVLVVGFVVRLFKDPLMDLYGGGAGADAASVNSASGYFLFTDALLGGLAAGAVAYLHLRASRAAGRRWPAYLVAGGLSGALLLLAEAITRIGGGPLLRLASSISAGDQEAFDGAGVARVKYGLVVFFLGAIVAMVAFGRTLPKHRPADQSEPAS